MVTKRDLLAALDQAIVDLEQAAGEVRVKLHLVGMDAKQLWAQKLEPQLHDARIHAEEASTASKAAVETVVKAVFAFAQTL